MNRERSILSVKAPDLRPDAYPDGPKGSPILGNFRGLQRHPIQYLTKASRNYGDLIHFRVFNQHIYMVNSPELIEQLLVAESRRTIKPRLLRYAKETLGEGLLTSDGEFWKRQRRLAQPAFHKKRIEDYSRIMVETAHEIVSQWRGRSDMDLHAEMMHLTLEIVARSLFGEQIGPNRTKEVGKILELLLKRFMSYVSLTYTFFDWFPRPGKLRYRNALQRLDTIVMEMIAHHRTMLKRGEEDPTLLGTYLRAVDDEGQSMTDRQLRDEVVTLFLAGHETTASALTFTLYLLWQHPQKRGALEAEVREVLNGRLPTINDIGNLPYTSNVLKEGMRLYPPAWRVGREATEDLNFDGWTIPAEAQILASQWTMHRDPHYFENPDSFHPERWSDGSLDSMPRYAYFPFGGGPRLCIGARFAETEAILILAIIAQRYRLDCKSLLRLELLPSITLRPKHPVNVKIQTIPVA